MDDTATKEAKPSQCVTPTCTFTAISSSNDRQVSYEGAKNGFFSYHLQALVRAEVAPLLAKAVSIEHLWGLWPRTGHSLVQDLGKTLHAQGIPQNPVWQTICTGRIGDKTRFFVE